jgi:hypothetical protein
MRTTESNRDFTTDLYSSSYIIHLDGKVNCFDNTGQKKIHEWRSLNQIHHKSDGTSMQKFALARKDPKRVVDSLHREVR